MTLAPSPIQIEYPESDGKPMGETDLHRYWMNRLYDLLQRRLAGQQAYVGCDLLVYYQEGQPHCFCVPDVFVALGAAPGRRRTYKVWEEGLPPTVVFEVTSASTRREDEVFKPRTYAEIGIREYFLYDPTADYLSPPLVGYRLTDKAPERIRPDSRGALQSQELGLTLSLEQGQLVLAEAASGQQLLTDAEAAELAAEEFEARALAAEAEVRRLREELERLKRQ
jgi:Uma2 family endonuclease